MSLACFQEKQRRTVLLITVALLAICGSVGTSAAQAAEPIVRAVLFFSPSCPHCHKVITEDLPPLFEKYGEQLQIVGVDTSTPSGGALYLATVDHFQIPDGRRGVPTLIVGDTVLVGSLEIPEEFPKLVEQHLATGGVDWPAIPGFAPPVEQTPTTVAPAASANPLHTNTQPAESRPASTVEPVLAENSVSTPTIVSTDASTSTQAEPTPNQAEGSIGESSPSVPSGLEVGDSAQTGVRGKLQRDPVGNTLSVLVLCGMVLGVVRVVMGNSCTARASVPLDFRSWVVAVLAVVGLGVSIYMAYVETSWVTAVCGPIGDCNTVHQSEYARLFGVIPVGSLGVLGYAGVLAAWTATRFAPGRLQALASLALLGIAFLGTLFSIYLTFLEPFVIGATCAWCLVSAVTMTLILVVVAGPKPLTGFRPAEALRSSRDMSSRASDGLNSEQIEVKSKPTD